MKKGFLKAICLAGVLAFTLPVVGYCDVENYEKENVVSDNYVDILSVIEEGDIEKLKDLIENGDISINGELFLAVREENLEKVKDLIENGAQ